jgi:hypothetical protein
MEEQAASTKRLRVHAVTKRRAGKLLKKPHIN